MQKAKTARRVLKPAAPCTSTASRAEAVQALREAVQGEIRWGAQEQLRPELDKRWDRVLMALGLADGR